MRNRIRELRKAKGRDWTLESVSAKLGTTPKQLSRLERGERSLTTDWMERIARVFECNPIELISTELGRCVAPLVGYVGAGEMYYPEPEYGPWIGFDEVDAPPGLERVVAVAVRGESMEPVYRPGDLLFFTPAAGLDPDSCIGRDCVVQVVNGPAYVKRVEREVAGAYRLASYKMDPLERVELEWASPVRWIRRS